VVEDWSEAEKRFPPKDRPCRGRGGSAAQRERECTRKTRDWPQVSAVIAGSLGQRCSAAIRRLEQSAPSHCRNILAAFSPRTRLARDVHGREPTWDRAFRIWRTHRGNSPDAAAQSKTAQAIDQHDPFDESRTRRSTRAISSSSISSASSWKFVCGGARESACAGKQFWWTPGRAGGSTPSNPATSSGKPVLKRSPGRSAARPRADRGPRALPPAQRKRALPEKKRIVHLICLNLRVLNRPSQLA